MKIGFVTFCNKRFLDIAKNLVDSLLAFSQYDIEVNCINFNHNFGSKRVVSKNVGISNESFSNICKVKIMSSLGSNFDVGLMLDADMLATKDVNKIFEENLDKIVDSKFPLFARHTHNLFNEHNILEAIKRYTPNTPKGRWVYATYLFDKENKWFFEEVLSEISKSDGDLSSFGFDEFIINALLAKYGVDRDIGYNYLPNGTNGLITDYLRGNLNSPELFETYLKHDCPVKFYLFHGHRLKWFEDGRGYLGALKAKK